MGNTLPCLVQGTTALPAAMKPKKRMYSLKLLTKALHGMKKRPCNNRAPKIASKSPPEAGGAAKGGGGGGAGVVIRSIKVSSNSKASPRRAAAAGAHGGGGGQRKGVVRMKVVLSKEEAARLLSLTVGGQKTAAQIVAEIKRWRPAAPPPTRRGAPRWRASPRSRCRIDACLVQCVHVYVFPSRLRRIVCERDRERSRENGGESFGLRGEATTMLAPPPMHDAGVCV